MPDASSSPPPRVRIVVAGDGRVGKSALVRRLVEDRFAPAKHAPTVGVDFGAHALDGAHVNLFDLGGAPCYAPVREEFYADAHALLLVFSLTHAPSFHALDGWLAEAAAGGLPPGTPLLLAGAQADDVSARCVPADDARRWGAAHGAT